MREVLISIQPKWIEKICREIGVANGKPIYEKRVEVRKTRPKCEMPFKCYIYCTMPKNKRDNLVLTPFGYDVGSESVYCNYIGNSNGKVIGEFVCDRITEYECSSDGFGELATTCGTCLTYDEILNYCNGNDLHGWHITDLIVYDEPRELSEFRTPEWFRDCEKQCDSMERLRCPTKDSRKVDKMCGWCRKGGEPITRPPMSWQFCVPTEPRQTAEKE